MIRCSLQIALVAAACLLGTPFVAFAGNDSLCGPFGLGAAAQAVSELAEPGISAGGTAGDQGSIVPLPTPGATPEASANDAPSEAVLALPKDESGQLPTDLELAPDTRVADSYWSPVVCATVARIAGPPGTPIEQLVTVLPDGSALVPNDVYASAAAGVETIDAPDVSQAEPDPYASLQYGLAVTGVREARMISSGQGVTVALLDSAPETEHRDLSAARIVPVGHGSAAEVGVHGTLMAGVINAIEDNGFGIAGVAPSAEVVSIPVCRPTAGAGGRCTIYDLLQGLDQAWDAHAQIVNLSLSGPPNILLERGVARLEELGAVVVAAAGNEGTRDRRYPAAYPSVIGVGAVDRDGLLFEASNRGPWVELMAPGVDVLSTVPGSAFAFGNGTSLAAAHVTGSLAVLTSVTGDPKRARGELFRAAGAGASGRAIPQVCDVFARLERSCEAPGNAEAPAD